MRRGWLGPLLCAFAGVVFVVIALVPRASGKTVDSTFLVLGIIFVVLALGSYRRLRITPSVNTNPRLPVSKTHEKHTR